MLRVRLGDRPLQLVGTQHPAAHGALRRVDVLGELDPVLDNLRLSDVAIAALEKAVALQPEYADAWTGLAAILTAPARQGPCQTQSRQPYSVVLRTKPSDAST